MRATKPEWQQKIARERVKILFDLAKKNLSKKPERSRRYVELARKIGMRYNVRFSKKMKESFCKKCNVILVPRKNMRVKADRKNKLLIISCAACNYSYRKPNK